jgi:hypothetical protein
MVIAARRAQLESGFVPEPLVSELIEPSAADGQSLGGGLGIDLALVKPFEDVVNRGHCQSIC